MYGGTPTADGYQQWIRANARLPVVAFYEKICRGLGCDSPADLVAPWQQCLFHPVWSLAWADQEKLDYLQNQQNDLQALRDAARQHSWSRLAQQLAANHEAYLPPPASARFYGELPLVDGLNKIGSADQTAHQNYPYPDFSSLWSRAMKNLTLNEMMVASIALKRFELKHGQPPPNLNFLMPEYLAKLPTDFMDGQPLGYCPNSDGTFTLSSVGNETRHIASPTASPAPANQAKVDGPWDRKNWVWPQIVPSPKRPAAVLQSRGG